MISHQPVYWETATAFPETTHILGFCPEGHLKAWYSNHHNKDGPDLCLIIGRFLRRSPFLWKLRSPILQIHPCIRECGNIALSDGSRLCSRPGKRSVKQRGRMIRRTWRRPIRVLPVVLYRSGRGWASRFTSLLPLVLDSGEYQSGFIAWAFWTNGLQY